MMHSKTAKLEGHISKGLGYSNGLQILHIGGSHLCWFPTYHESTALGGHYEYVSKLLKWSCAQLKSNILTWYCATIYRWALSSHSTVQTLLWAVPTIERWGMKRAQWTLGVCKISILSKHLNPFIYHLDFKGFRIHICKLDFNLTMIN